MTHIDDRFSKETLQTLQEAINEEFVKYRCDPFKFSNTVFGVVWLFIGKKLLRLENELHVINYFGGLEDICLLTLQTAEESEITSRLGGVGQTNTPIRRTIKELRVINECQSMVEDGTLTYTWQFTRGLIFVMDDGYEIAFERTNPFTELIAISRGAKTLLNFRPLSESVADFDPPCVAKASRTMLILDGKSITEKPLETARTPQKE